MNKLFSKKIIKFPSATLHLKLTYKTATLIMLRKKSGVKGRLLDVYNLAYYVGCILVLTSVAEFCSGIVRMLVVLVQYLFLFY